MGVPGGDGGGVIGHCEQQPSGRLIDIESHLPPGIGTQQVHRPRCRRLIDRVDVVRQRERPDCGIRRELAGGAVVVEVGHGESDPPYVIEPARREWIVVVPEVHIGFPERHVRRSVGRRPHSIVDAPGGGIAVQPDSWDLRDLPAAPLVGRGQHGQARPRGSIRQPVVGHVDNTEVGAGRVAVDGDVRVAADPGRSAPLHVQRRPCLTEVVAVRHAHRMRTVVAARHGGVGPPETGRSRDRPWSPCDYAVVVGSAPRPFPRAPRSVQPRPASVM